MATTNTDQHLHTPLATFALSAIALTVACVHMLTNGRYGFHRDELQFLSDAQHLAWGFVSYPPFTPFLERIGLEIFGVSLVALRLFSVIAQSVTIFVTGLMVREFGGQRTAQIAAALTVALSPLPLFQGTEFQYSSFDYLWWVLTAFFVIRLLNTENPQWCLAVGLIIGVGLMTKYTILFFVAGILTGFLLTPARRFLKRWQFWAGIGLALLICLPNLIWQIRHDFISLHFLRHIHTRDIGEGRADGFVRHQFLICTNLFAAPLWIAGLLTFLRQPRYRALAWMYLLPFALFFIGKGRGYYMAAAYPMLIAMGAAAAEHWTAKLSRPWRRTVQLAFFAGLALCGAFICAVVLPLASRGPLRDFALRNNGDLREEIGWDELVKTVAAIRDALPPEQQQNVGVLTGNYGEQGAIQILGKPYHLPPPIGMTNSAWLRRYPVPPPSPLIVLGFSRNEADRAFTSCRLAGQNRNPYGIKNEESQFHPDIFLCDAPRLSWPEFWTQYQSFG
jgi:hypothetical protein